MYSTLSKRAASDPLWDVDNWFRFANGSPSWPQINTVKVRGPWRKENSIVVQFEVPGVDPDKISVSVKGKGIQVKAPGGGEAYVSVGERLDYENCEASAKWGLLTVTVPTREAKTTEIVVKKEE